MVLLLLSLAANFVLLIAWHRARQPAVVYQLKLPPRPALTTNILRPIRTNLVIEPHLLSWADIESPDYPTYIRNLRNIGCPEPTIRDIVVADVNELFSRRRATDVPSVNQQWWLAEPDEEVVEKSLAQQDALEAERRDLLTRLLGPAWDVTGTAVEVPGSAITLDGPLLGELAPETKRALRDIEFRAREQRRAYTQTRRDEGKPVDPAELVRLSRSTRDELARVLGPAELEEYLLRYSNNAAELRKTLHGFDASPEEFRGLFRAVDAIDLERAALSDSNDPATVRQRQELEAKREEAIRAALPAERYTYYHLNQDPGFRQARETAEQLGAPAEAVVPLFQINQETDRERGRILNDPSLTPEQQNQELAGVDQVRLDSLRRLLGEERFRRWQAGDKR